jgi:hypothetical protein
VIVLKAIFFPVYIPYRLLVALQSGATRLGMALVAGADQPKTIYPKCVNCHHREFTFRTSPTYTVNRFSQRRISTIVECDNCGLHLRMSMVDDGKGWTFDLPN